MVSAFTKDCCKDLDEKIIHKYLPESVYVALFMPVKSFFFKFVEFKETEKKKEEKVTDDKKK